MFGREHDVFHTCGFGNACPITRLEVRRIESFVKVVIDIDRDGAFVGALRIRIGAGPAEFLPRQRHRTVMDEQSEAGVHPPAQPFWSDAGSVCRSRLHFSARGNQAEDKYARCDEKRKSQTLQVPCINHVRKAYHPEMSPVNALRLGPKTFSTGALLRYRRIKN